MATNHFSGCSFAGPFGAACGLEYRRMAVKGTQMSKKQQTPALRLGVTAANRRSPLKWADPRRPKCPGKKTCRQVEGRALVRQGRNREPLKSVVMEFDMRVGAVMQELLAVARKACAKADHSGNFDFKLGGRRMQGLARLEAAERCYYVWLGDYTIQLQEVATKSQWCRLGISAGVTLCYGRTLAEVVVHLSAMAADLGEIEAGRLHSTWPEVAVPVGRDDDAVHVEGTRFNAMPYTETTPRFYIATDFARWLARQRFG
jgi:hypothetical protein